MSSLNKLRENFDKVLIKYTEDSCEVLLSKGLNIYIGISRRIEGDNFDRKLGRTIALGRAEHAFNVATNNKNSRDDSCCFYTDGKCKYTSETFGDVNQLDQCIIDFLPKKTEVAAS